MRPDEQIRLWRDELIDLTKRNKLISLGKGSGLLTIESPYPERVLRGLDGGWGFHYPEPGSSEASDESLLVALDAESSDDGAETLRIASPLPKPPNPCFRDELQDVSFELSSKRPEKEPPTPAPPQ